MCAMSFFYRAAVIGFCVRLVRVRAAFRAFAAARGVFSGGCALAEAEGASASAVVERRESGVVLEVASHETLRGEIHAGGDFFDAQIGVAQQTLDFHHHQHGDPLAHGAATHIFNELRQIFRGELQLIGVPIHTALLSKIAREQLHEAIEDVECSRVEGFSARAPLFEQLAEVEIETL